MEKQVVADIVGKPVDWTERLWDHMMDLAMTRGVDIVQALIIAVIGYMLCRWIRRVVRNMLTRSTVEDSAVTFVTEIVYFLSLIIVGITALGTAGVSTTTLSAALGGIGLGIGLAMKDQFGNVASGIFILIFKPFRVGDYITAAGNSGTVSNIRIMSTEMKTTGNQVVVIPNVALTSSVIVNYTTMDTRNVEMNIGVGYDTDLPACVALLKHVFMENPHVLNKETISVYVKDLGDSAIMIYARAEVARADYFNAMNDLYIAVKQALDQAGIDIPFPQVVLHQVKTHSAAEDHRKEEP